MNHPTPEAWAEYVYGECDAPTKADLEAHVAVCPACRVQLDQFRRIQSELTAYTLPQIASASRSIRLLPRGPWLAAAAAAGVFLLGVATTLLISGGQNRDEAIQTRLKPAIRQELEALMASSNTLRATPVQLTQSDATQPEIPSTTAPDANEELRTAFAEFLTVYRNDRAEDRAVLANAIQQLERQRRADYIRLRSDLETVALTTSDQLSRTRSDLSQLAVYTVSDDRPNPPAPKDKDKGRP